VFIEAQTGCSFGQDGPERGFAHQRLTPQVVAVPLDQIEGVQEHAGVMPPVADAIEARHAIVIAGNGLASMKQERERNLARASTISGKRKVRSLPGRL
jgi:hypothetical protein